MGTLSAFLMSISLPIVIRVIVGLGFSFASFAGVTVFLNELMAIAQANWSGLPVTVLQLASLSGIPESMGMIASAAVARIGVWVALMSTRFIRT